MSEIDELKSKLERITSHVGCMYCGREYAYSQKDELADHIASCEKSPLVQMVKEMESRITDYMDLMNDEFCRIVALNPGPEIASICQRAMTIIHQKVPVIQQRDDLLKHLFEAGSERDQLKAELATLKIGTNSALAVIISERDEAKAELAGIRQALQTEYRSPIGDEDILDLMGNFIDHHKEKESELAQARAHNAALLKALKQHVCVHAIQGEGMNRTDYYPVEKEDCELCAAIDSAITLEKGEPEFPPNRRGSSEEAGA